MNQYELYDSSMKIDMNTSRSLLELDDDLNNFLTELETAYKKTKASNSGPFGN